MEKKYIGAVLFVVGAMILDILSVHAAAAANIYVAQNAAGAGNGSSCANAAAYAFFNDPSNWGSGTNQIGPGTTVHVCGIISVPANTEAFIFQGSGASGNPITLYFESGAALMSPEWPAQGSGGAIDTRGNSYLVINGNGGANGAVEGIIEATATGDTGAVCPSGSCTYHNDSNGIEADGTTNFTVEGLSIIDMYVTAPGVPSGGGGSCMWDHGQVINWNITGNLMHDVSWCINLQYDSGPSSNITISNNQIYNIDHGIAIGGPHAGESLTNVNIFGNYIHDYSNWDTGVADIWHHDGVHIWGYNDDGSDPISNINIYDNRFGGCIGQNVTAHVFIEGNSGNTRNVDVYNNSFIDTCNGQDNDGLLSIDDTNESVYNNTFIGGPNDVCMGISNAQNAAFKNNVVSGCNQLIYIASGGATFVPGGLNDNVYANCSSGNCFAFPGGYTSSFSAWQSYTGQDQNSHYVANAGLSSGGIPQSGSTAIAAGANLSYLGISLLDADIAGVVRPSSGSWDAGAYEVSSGSGGGSSGGTTPPPAVPIPAITSAASASATVGMGFSYTITASNSPTAYSASGLPSGLSVNGSTGIITGTPALSGTYSVVLFASNSGGTGSAPLTITVAAASVTPSSGSNGGGSSSVALDAKSATPLESASGATSLSGTPIIIGTGTDRALVVSFSWAGCTPLPTNVAITWDAGGANQAMTLIESRSDISDPGMTQLWGLVNPGSGAKKLAATWTNGCSTGSADMGALSVTGANQAGGTATFANGIGTTGSAATWSQSVTSASGDMAVTGVGSVATVPTPVTETPWFSYQGVNAENAGASYGAGASTVTFSYNSGGYSAAPYEMVGMDIVAASGSADTVPPVVAIASPLSGATVSNTVSVTAAASDNVGVVKVGFYLDGILQVTDISAPYVWNWNTAGVTNGLHVVSAKAYDAAGNVGTSANEAVTVANASAVTTTSTITANPQPVTTASSSAPSNPTPSPTNGQAGSGSSGGSVFGGGGGSGGGGGFADSSASSAGGGGGSGGGSGVPSGTNPSAGGSGGASASEGSIALLRSLTAELDMLIEKLNVQLVGAFTRNLTVGSTGSDVKKLQIFLNDNGYPVSADGSGSAGHESMYFGGKTAGALAAWQNAHGLPNTGFFGPLTREKMDALY